MSKILFTDKDVKKLSKNKYVKKVSNKAITYTNEFKEKVVFETENYRKFPRQVFEECGFDIDVIGLKRMDTRDKGFNGMIGIVTMLIICQVLPLIFAIVVKGWRD